MMRTISAVALAIVLYTGSAAAQSFGVANFFAAVSPQGETIRGSGVQRSSRTALGKYSVVFTRPVTSCAFAAAVRAPVGGHASITGPVGDGRRVVVSTFSSSGVAANRAFDMIILCAP